MTWRGDWVDLGFGFSYNEIPKLFGTLQALDFCNSMRQQFLDEHPSSSKAKQAVPEPRLVVPANLDAMTLNLLMPGLCSLCGYS